MTRKFHRQVAAAALAAAACHFAGCVTAGPAKRPSVTVTLPLGTKVTGGLTDKEILRVFAANLNQVRYCYEDLVKESPTAAGRLRLAFEVDESGNAAKIVVKEATIDDKTMLVCLRGKLSRWIFPKARNEPAKASVPLLFKLGRA